MGRLIFVIGGARSGKSSFAQQTAAATGGGVCYLATAQALDDEMRARIARHRADRPGEWLTVEEPGDLAAALRKMPAGIGTVIIDCLTLFATNILMENEGRPSEEIRLLLLTKIEEMLAACREADFDAVVVSNETGLGLVPDNPLGRVFRDLTGEMNRLVAAEADEVRLMVAGIPLSIKESR